jgi:uncharacterized protein with PIN domain
MRLLLDVMCGGLRPYLRMCGHDTAYALDRDIEADDRLLALARSEERTLVTRDVALADRADDSIRIRETAVEDQLRELDAAGVNLSLADAPERCGRCNGPLRRTEDRTPEYAPSPHKERVWRCTECGQCFWKGSHWDSVEETLASLSS